MPSRFCEVYSLGSPNELVSAAFYDYLQTKGYSLFFPNTCDVFIWRNGKQFPVSKDTFFREVQDSSQKEISFQLWNHNKEDLFCCRSVEDQGVTLMMWMDGYSTEKRAKFIELFLKMVAEDRVFPKAVGLLVDLNETALPGEWENFFFKGGTCPKLTPDIVGFIDHYLSRFKHQSAHPVSARMDEFMLFSWPVKGSVLEK